MSEPPQKPAGTVRQIKDRCTAVLDSITHALHCKCTGEEKKICGFRQENPQRAAFADISLQEQGEIRALQEEGGGEEGGKLGKALCIIKLSSGREAPEI